MNFLYVLLMAPASEDGEGGGIMSFLPLILIVLIFYLFMIRPQIKKNKDMKKYRENLQKGDKVVTIGGVHGKIIEMQDTAVIIEVEGQNRLKIEKSAIAMDSRQIEQRR